MKKFTVKDFITYNSPCFGCGNKINFYFEIDTPNAGTVSKRALVGGDFTEVDLIIHYSDPLKINITHKTNKFIASSNKSLTTYMKEHKLSMRTRCDKCYSTVASQPLEFNMDKGFVCPVEIREEVFLITNELDSYQIYSSGSKSTVHFVSASGAVMRLTLPLLPLYKFKTKEKFVNKIKTYIVFS